MFIWQKLIQPKSEFVVFSSSTSLNNSNLRMEYSCTIHISYISVCCSIHFKFVVSSQHYDAFSGNFLPLFLKAIKSNEKERKLCKKNRSIFMCLLFSLASFVLKLPHFICSLEKRIRRKNYIQKAHKLNGVTKKTNTFI